MPSGGAISTIFMRKGEFRAEEKMA